jgi:hypothetical protein
MRNPAPSTRTRIRTGTPTPTLTMGSSRPIHTRAKAAKLSQICGLCVVPQAVAERGQAKKTEQSRNVYENKGNGDILPPESSDILVESTRIVGHFVTNRHESSAILSPIDKIRRTFLHQMTSNGIHLLAPAFPRSNHWNSTLRFRSPGADGDIRPTASPPWIPPPLPRAGAEVRPRYGRCTADVGPGFSPDL